MVIHVILQYFATVGKELSTRKDWESSFERCGGPVKLVQAR